MSLSLSRAMELLTKLRTYEGNKVIKILMVVVDICSACNSYCR